MRLRGWLKLETSQWRSVTLILACCAFCSGLGLSGALQGLELRSLDLRFALRDRLQAYPAEADEPRAIALIEIDDESARSIPEPYILWDRHFAAVVTALSASGAAVIAADILWLKAVDDFLELKGESPRKSLVRALLRARDTLVLAELAEPASEASRRIAASAGGGQSLGRHRIALGPAPFAVANPFPDADGVIRRQRRFYAAGKVPSFPYKAASLFSGKELAAGNDSVLIDFRASRLPFDRFQFHEVLARAQAGDAAWFQKNFAGKIALIGSTSNLTDRHASPLGKQTPGAWIHAFAMGTFLGANPLRPTGPWSHLAIILISCLAAGVPALRSAWAPGLAWTGGMALAWLALAQVLFHHRVVAGAAAPLAAILITSGAVLLYRFAVADRDKRRLAKVLRGYVNPRIVEAALRAPDNADILKGSRRRVTILFSDVRGFTKLSEGLPPERVVKFLNRYLTAMSDIILDHDGTIDKFVGDGIMGFFGAPVRQANPSLQAVRAALAMHKRLEALNLDWKKEGLPEIKIGVGIHAGDAIVGNIGSARKMDYTAIGDTTNLASRIESLTKEFKRPILITQEVYEHVKKSVDVEPLGRAEVRGHSPVSLFAVLGMKALLLCLSLPAFGAETEPPVVGIVGDVKGDVRWSSPRKGRLDMLDDLHAGDSLRLGAGATVSLLYFAECSREEVAGPNCEDNRT